MKNIFSVREDMCEGTMSWRFCQQSKNLLTSISGSCTHAHYFTGTRSHALKPADWLWNTDVHTHINIPVRIYRNLALAMTHRETLDPTSVASHRLDSWQTKKLVLVMVSQIGEQKIFKFLFGMLQRVFFFSDMVLFTLDPVDPLL